MVNAAPLQPLVVRRGLRIAQVAPLHEAVPPRQYGGTERVVAYLTDALVARGHSVTLFATADSQTRAKLVPCAPSALRGNAHVADPLAWHLLQLQEVVDRADEFDVVHFHTDYLHYPMDPLLPPTVTTLHGRLDFPDLAPIYRRFTTPPLVSISHAQRRPLPDANWIATVYHGLPRDLYCFGGGGGGYAVFLGRISREKGPEHAIEIACNAGLPLRIAAKIDRADIDYFEREIRPLLAQPGVEFLGEVNEADKSQLLGAAEALLFPINWPEPFGLVMIEALACGTPVIAFGHGSVSEIIEHGRTGFVVDSIAAAATALGNARSIERHACRDAFEQRFSAERMAADYERVYAQVIAHERHGTASVVTYERDSRSRP